LNKRNGTKHHLRSHGLGIAAETTLLGNEPQEVCCLLLLTSFRNLCQQGVAADSPARVHKPLCLFLALSPAPGQPPQKNTFDFS